MKLNCLLLTLAATASLAGCSSFNDEVDRFILDKRNCVLAHSAWLAMKSYYGDIECRHDFGKGFRAGYRDVASGGDGCQPTLPPRCYWSVCYQTPDGHCRIMAWFDGFTHGAVAARQDGIDAFSQIPISPTARENFRISNTPVIDDYGWSSEVDAPPSPAPPSTIEEEDGQPVLPPDGSDVPERRPYEEPREDSGPVDEEATPESDSAAANLAPRDFARPRPPGLPPGAPPAGAEPEPIKLPAIVQPAAEGS